ncbi:RluA family pseudouridine synthase [Lacipirellula parvula]|uniref:Pseudouridine synthase n=1 Tax=Lacipirellula parvula TaxID=2650471 RepID=A0A5K7X958_9BACT|nr:RluA family pseudouridine synthase [Lacipirellula parvula]BBO32895.1 ribosomal large subunit pseudouridine synthase D [Lacipirellula parvula]
MTLDDEGAWDDEVAPVTSLASEFGDYTLTVDEAMAGQRIDAFLAAAIDGVSRARIRRSIDEGLATVNGTQQKAAYRTLLGDQIQIRIAAAVEAPLPEPIPLDLLYEDDVIAVVNKPAGMVVHPAKGHWAGTLAAALVHRFNDGLSAVGGQVRPGIVHRLDRETSGAIVVAKNDAAHESLARQFHDREVQKEYLAISAGRFDRDADRVNEPIGPHPTHREKMAIRGDHPDSRPAETFFEVLERFPGFALVRCRPKTGRTHQIRLHLMHLRCPVLCDKQYGSRSRITIGEVRGITRQKRLGGDALDDEVLLARHALHAHRLSFAHPMSGAAMTVEAPLPKDMERFLEVLRSAAGS